MKQRRRMSGRKYVALLVLIVALVWALPVSPAQRIRREHGLFLPSSAAVLSRSRRGGWTDGSAEALIWVPARDLAGFLAQLRPGRPDRLVQFGLRHGAWQKQGSDGERWYFCHSRRGDLLGVIVGSKQADRIKVRLITSWD